MLETEICLKHSFGNSIEVKPNTITNIYGKANRCLCGKQFNFEGENEIQL